MLYRMEKQGQERLHLYLNPTIALKKIRLLGASIKRNKGTSLNILYRSCEINSSVLGDGVSGWMNNSRQVEVEKIDWYKPDFLHFRGKFSTIFYLEILLH